MGRSAMVVRFSIFGCWVRMDLVGSRFVEKSQDGGPLDGQSGAQQGSGQRVLNV